MGRGGRSKNLLGGDTEEILILYGLHDFSSYITEIQYTYFYAVWSRFFFKSDFQKPLSFF